MYYLLIAHTGVSDNARPYIGDNMPKYVRPSPVVQIVVPPEVRDRLKAIAETEGTTASKAGKEALTEYVKGFDRQGRKLR